MAKKKRIIDKIKINQSLVKDKSQLPIVRQKAYLELKRLNNLKQQGNIVKRPNFEMYNVSKIREPFEHNYLIYETDKKNNVLINVITHGRIPYKKEVKSLNSFIGLKLINKSKSKKFKDKDLKFYDFYESNLNDKIDPNELNEILELIKINNNFNT